MTTSSANNSVFRGFFEKQKLIGPNFIDWYRQLRIVLSIEDKLNYLEQPLPPVLVAPEGQQVALEIIAAHTAWIKGSKEIVGLMLMTMEPEIQRNLENLHAYEMLQELKTLFAQQAEQELLQTTRDFHSCNLILIGLRKEFDGFVQNYNIHSLGKTVNELHAMLKLHEQTLTLSKNNAPALHAIRAGKVQKGHWKRNCPQYLAELLKKKKNAASGAGGSGIFTIELNTFLNRSWIYDTGCGTHICNTTHGLRASRKLKPGALSLYVGNGQREAVEAIGVFYLCLPSGLEIVLNNCHYAPSITRGVISVSRLYEDGFINRFVNNTIQVSVYFSAIPRDGIFEIDLSNSYANESSIYTVSNKRAKLDLDSALLWHCRLGHISKKRIEKLQHDGLLNSTDLRAFEKCVPCMSGKMARKPYTHQVERAKDLLGLIHTDSNMDPIIPLGQKNTLAEYMILSGANNRPPMLDKDLYDSWKIPTVILSTDSTKYDLKATNIVLQGLPPDEYAIVNHHKVAKEIYDRVKFYASTKLSISIKGIKLFMTSFDTFSLMQGETLYISTTELLLNYSTT
ncbi:zinc finger, CCHC-type containing protein [Tanacetum coccineum]